MTLYPETLDDLEETGIRRRGSNLTTWNCGCEKRGLRMYLCQFHEGFEAGIETTQSAAALHMGEP